MHGGREWTKNVKEFRLYRKFSADAVIKFDAEQLPDDKTKAPPPPPQPLQTGVALVFWPIRRYLPERRALANLYAELARAAVAPPDIRQSPPASAQSTEAQTALASLEGDYSIEGERYRSLLNQAERTRLALFALRRLRVRIAREAPHGAETTLVERYLEIASRVLASIGEALVAAQPAESVRAQLDELQALAERLRATAAQLQDARYQMDAINGPTAFRIRFGGPRDCGGPGGLRPPGSPQALASAAQRDTGHVAREPELALGRLPACHPAGGLRGARRCSGTRLRFAPFLLAAHDRGHRAETGLRLYIQPRRAAVGRDVRRPGFCHGPVSSAPRGRPRHRLRRLRR
jgi:hypothetical protein